MNTRDLNAMLVEMTDDEKARAGMKALDNLSKAEASLRKLVAAPSLTREPAEERVRHAKAMCQECGAVGSECR